MADILHYIDSDIQIASKGANVYISHRERTKQKLFITLPLDWQAGLYTLSSLSSRLFRFHVHHAIRFNKNKIVIIGFKRIYSYDLNTGELNSDILMGSGRRPLNICNAGDSKIYYGEYFNNRDRMPVCIYGSVGEDLKFEPVWQFKDVRHIHGVFFDPYYNNIWITTGDTDDESGIWVTNDNFHALEKVIGGNQQFRAVQLLFTEKYIYFGSDTPLERNFIYRINRNSGRTEKLNEVESSVFWGCKVKDYLFFSTSVEPSTVNKTRYACIWGSPDGEKWKCIKKFKKDIYPIKLFQYGQIYFPSGENQTDKLWFTPWATEHHQTSQYIDINQINWT